MIAFSRLIKFNSTDTQFNSWFQPFLGNSPITTRNDNRPIGSLITEPGQHSSRQLEDVMEIRDVADGQSQYFNFRQLLVRWQSWKKFPQLSESHVECLDTDSLPGRMSYPVLEGRSSAPPSLLPRQTGKVVFAVFHLGGGIRSSGSRGALNSGEWLKECFVRWGDVLLKSAEKVVLFAEYVSSTQQKQKKNLIFLFKLIFNMSKASMAGFKRYCYNKKQSVERARF